MTKKLKDPEGYGGNRPAPVFDVKIKERRAGYKQLGKHIFGARGLADMALWATTEVYSKIYLDLIKSRSVRDAKYSDALKRAIRNLGAAYRELDLVLKEMEMDGDRGTSVEAASAVGRISRARDGKRVDARRSPDANIREDWE